MLDEKGETKLKSNYKGIKIEYNEFSQCFEFTVKDIVLQTYTFEQAKKSVDNYIYAKQLIGRKVIGFSGEDGKVINTTIKKVEFEKDRSKFVHSSGIIVDFYDENNKKLPTLGPFFDYSSENFKIANEIERLKAEERETRRKHDDLWRTFNDKRIKGEVEK